MNEASRVEFETIPFTITGEGKESLTFRVWNGNIQMSVFTQDSGKPRFTESINPRVYEILKNTIRQIQAATPETSLPIVFQSFEPTTKKWNTRSVIKFVKNSNMVYEIHIKVKDDRGEAVFKFVLKGTNAVQCGADPMKDHEKSAIDLQALVTWLSVYAPTMRILTYRKPDFNGKNSNTNKPLNKLPQPGAEDNKLFEDDDIPF